jgi:hypothetical protein
MHGAHSRPSGRRREPPGRRTGATGRFTIKDLGGWSEVNKKVSDKEAGVAAGMEGKVGVSVGS